MKKWCSSVLLVMAILAIACGPRDEAVRVEKHNGQKLYVCDYFKVKDNPVQLKLSDMIDSLEIIKLDDDTNAMVEGGEVYFSENYMLLRAGYKIPIKLFDRKGKYLNDVGVIGRGPGEYVSVSDMQIDEKRGRLYLMPWQNRVINVYDLEGKFAGVIPLRVGMPKGRFVIQDTLIKVVTLPFRKMVKWAAFYQTMGGKLLDSVPAAPYAVTMDYSNEVLGDWDNNSVFYFVWKGKQDSLYHYEPGSNSLTPCFTVDYGGIQEIPMHDYHETGNYFWFITSVKERTGENTWTDKPEKSVLVDKEKCTATSSYTLENDFLGYKTFLRNFSNGYYTENINPLALKKKLEKAQERDDLSPETQKRIKDLLADIDEEGNNYVMIGKMKR